MSERILIDQIVVGPRLRPLDEGAVDRLASGMAKIGLRCPIWVRYVNDEPHLVAGQFRLAAAVKLGWEFIDCEIERDGETKAQIWEVVENLDRVGLNSKERTKHIRRLARLMRADAVPPKTRLSDGRIAPPQNQVSTLTKRIVEATGIPGTTVRRALRSPEKNVVLMLRPPDPIILQAEPVHHEFGTASRDRLMEAWRDASELDRRWFCEYAVERLYASSTA